MTVSYHSGLCKYCRNILGGANTVHFDNFTGDENESLKCSDKSGLDQITIERPWKHALGHLKAVRFRVRYGSSRFLVENRNVIGCR